MIIRCIIVFGLFFPGLLSAYGKKSFVIVIDTTGSMKDEITILKNHIHFVANSVNITGDFENYILVPFADLDIGAPQVLVYDSPEGLVNYVSDIEVTSGAGTDCPENSLAAVEKALQESNNNSNIFLFTDAPAKDYEKLRSIQSLCQQRKSQVVIFLSGSCSEDSSNNINAYYDIAKSCSGNVFHTFVSLVRSIQVQPFKYMKAISNVDWSNINTHTEFMGRKQFNFDVDVHTKDVVIAISGEYPEAHITHSDFSKSVTVEKIMDTRRSLVIRLLRPELGEYSAELSSRGVTLASFYKLKELKFFYGFSPRKARNVKETSERPLPDSTSYIIIELLSPEIELSLLELKYGENKRTLDVEKLDETKGIYRCQSYFEAEQPFKITVHGRKKETYEAIKGSTVSIFPQKASISGAISSFWSSATKPSVLMVEPTSTLVEFMTNATIFCKLRGDPKPDIWWEDGDGNKINSENALFEIPSVYISYATVENATANTTIYCKCKNSAGKDNMSMDLFVHRDFTFEVLQYPSDHTIEYGSEGKLYCEASAYPEATIKWYHNDSLVEDAGNVVIVPDENALVIKNMTLDDTGEYKCVMTNEVEEKTYTAIVDISGLVAPSVAVEKSEYILKPGDFMETECKVLSGNPPPEVYWKRVVDDFDDDEVPDGVYMEGKTLKIPAANRAHGGVYKCEATNIYGMDSKEVQVKVYYAPKMKSGDETKNVQVGDTVELDCDVDANPKAEVRWHCKDDSENRHRTDARNTHRFIATVQDSGEYHCEAQNEMGRAEKTVTVNVLVAPYIEDLDSKILTVRAGSSIVLKCNVLVGHPVPSTRWEFTSSKSSVAVLSRDISSKLDLKLQNITRKDEGTYQCVSENEVGLDEIRVFLKVQS